MGNTITTVEHTTTVPFVCGECRFESVAVVRTRGQSHFSSLLNITSDGVNSEAARRAQEEGETNASRLVSLAACPQCGHTPHDRRTRIHDGSVDKRLLASAAVGALVFFMFQRQEGLLMAGIAAAVTFVTFKPRDAWMVREVDDRVQVLGVTEFAAFKEKAKADEVALRDAVNSEVRTQKVASEACELEAAFAVHTPPVRPTSAEFVDAVTTALRANPSLVSEPEKVGGLEVELVQTNRVVLVGEPSAVPGATLMAVTDALVRVAVRLKTPTAGGLVAELDAQLSRHPVLLRDGELFKKLRV